MTLSSTTNSGPPIAVTAAVVHKVTCDLPLQGATHVKEMAHIKPLALADPTFHLPGKVDLLLGCDVITDIMLPGQVSGPKNTPMALNTVFRWAVMERYQPQITNHCVHAIIPTQVNQSEALLLTRFWEVEEVSPGITALTPEEESMQRHYSETHKYIQSPGHYEVSLPRREGCEQLGLSRPQALNRYLGNERSIQRKGTYTAFQEVVKEYLQLGHAEAIPASSLNSKAEIYYLPMHGVTKDSSTTTKLRVVFDASAKCSNSISLNQTLAVGPTLYPTLETILLRFRLHPIALTAVSGSSLDSIRQGPP